MSDSHFWDDHKSATLSTVAAWVALALAVGVAPFLIPILRQVSAGLVADNFVVRAAGPLYVCLAAGIVALALLLVMLADIGRGDVFTLANARRLRLISYCGATIMAAFLVTAVVAGLWPVFVLMALVAGFMALLMNVIKNVIDAARLLKEDVDYTI
jgi:hypothetical protein